MDRFFVVQFLFFAVWTAALLYYPPLSATVVPLPSGAATPPRAGLRPPVQPAVRPPGFAQPVPAAPVPPAQPAPSGAAQPAAGKQGANGEWVEELAYAKQVATSTSRPIAMLFTGSDWCSWCQKLHAEVFDKPEWKTFAAEKLVLCKLDFPRRLPQAPDIRVANRALQQQYNVTGFPTVVITDATGRELGRTGYQAGGPPAFIDELRKSLPR